MENITLNINGKSVQALPGTTLLQAAKSAGIHIPTLCNDDGLEPYGACRMCMVEVEKQGKRKLVASCLYNVEAGLIVQTDTEKVQRIRKMIIELLYPAWLPYANEYGVTSSRFTPGMTDCSLCGLCVRYCAEIKGAGMMYFKGRGIDRKPALLDDADTSCSGCRDCFKVCSGGGIASRC